MYNNSDRNAVFGRKTAYKKLQNYNSQSLNNFKQINPYQAIADCPCCGYKSAMSISRKNGRELYFCHAGCNPRKLWQVIIGTMPVEVNYRTCDSYKKQNNEGLDNYIRTLWNSSILAKHSVVEYYLRSRGIESVPSTIRLLPHHLHKPTGQYLPVMLAKVTDYEGNLKAVHRTYLTADGKKSAVEPVKMTLGNIAGYAVHLDKPDIVMAITEGICTGLSVQQSCNISTWSALSAGGIRKLNLPPLPLAKEVIICADMDANLVGQNSASVAAKRWLTEGRKVKIALPPKLDTDFNDLLLEADYV